MTDPTPTELPAGDYAAVFAGWPQVQERLALGMQFNAYAHGRDDDETGECVNWMVCLGPITNAFAIVETSDAAVANLLVDVMRFAAQ